MAMEKQINIETSFSVDGITIIPISRISKGEMHHRNFIHFYVKREPVAVIVVRGPSCYIYNEKGKEILMEDFLNDFPEQGERIREIINQS